MTTIKQLARMTLHHRTLTNPIHAMQDYAAAVKHLEALGFNSEDAHNHPVAILLADRIALLTRTDTINDNQIMQALNQVRALANS